MGHLRQSERSASSHIVSFPVSYLILGLVSLATSPDSTLLVVPGMQLGHVQLVRLPPCPPPPLSITTSPDHKPSLLAAAPGPSSRHTASMIVAHETALTTLTVAPSSRLLATTSSRGTLIRVWDTYSGRLIKELRRGADQAEIYGVAFRPDEHALCVWSDKGTIHVFTLHEKQRLRSLPPLLYCGIC
jgi:WD repeat-containing protein 45